MRVFPFASRTFAFAAVVAAVAACAPAPPRAPSSRVVLRGADCLDPSQARGWHEEASSSAILVDAGRRRYRIVLPPYCLRAGGNESLRFEGDPVSGRVCGLPGDAILLRGERCPIQSMEIVDAGSATP